MLCCGCSVISVMAQRSSPGRFFLAPRLLLLVFLLLPALTAQAGMPGGLQEQPVSDPEVQKAAQFALAAYNQRSNSLYYSRALRVVKAQSQVVAGIKYYLTVEVVNTTCAKNRGGGRLTAVDIERCPLPPNAEQQKQICEFQVWSRPWLNDTQLTSMKCKPASS
ncbi:cystatin-like [Hemicordylus capensis]|uniref:cystatin-like n=1 Tax=Hemicordylus capensis TaxID=884348 RepID=UPI002304B299|nr:cystatin-like [Hemicordylus capensis]